MIEVNGWVKPSTGCVARSFKKVGHGFADRALRESHDLLCLTSEFRRTRNSSPHRPPPTLKTKQKFPKYRHRPRSSMPVGRWLAAIVKWRYEAFHYLKTSTRLYAGLTPEVA